MHADQLRSPYCTQVPTFLGKRWREACDSSIATRIRPELGIIEEVAGVQVLLVGMRQQCSFAPPTLQLSIVLTGSRKVLEVKAVRCVLGAA